MFFPNSEVYFAHLYNQPRYEILHVDNRKVLVRKEVVESLKPKSYKTKVAQTYSKSKFGFDLKACKLLDISDIRPTKSDNNFFLYKKLNNDSLLFPFSSHFENIKLLAWSGSESCNLIFFI